MTLFDKKIEAAWPDPEVDGWMVLQLECGHHTHQPKGTTNKTCHCGTCRLNHEAHQRALKAFEKKNAPIQPPSTP